MQLYVKTNRPQTNLLSQNTAYQRLCDSITHTDFGKFTQSRIRFDEGDT